LLYKYFPSKEAIYQEILRLLPKRDFEAEELEIVRALATQASLAIQFTQLAKSAKQSAVLEEGRVLERSNRSRNRICMCGCQRSNRFVMAPTSGTRDEERHLYVFDKKGPRMMRNGSHVNLLVTRRQDD
jgi:AcrR family transcriptional regulator